jgi:hypothetical protein
VPFHAPLNRGLVVSVDGPSRLPALLQRYQRRLQHIIFDDFAGSALPVTDFQEKIWDALSLEGDAALAIFSGVHINTP